MERCFPWQTLSPWWSLNEPVPNQYSFVVVEKQFDKWLVEWLVGWAWSPVRPATGRISFARRLWSSSSSNHCWALCRLGVQLNVGVVDSDKGFSKILVSSNYVWWKWIGRVWIEIWVQSSSARSYLSLLLWLFLKIHHYELQLLHCEKQSSDCSVCEQFPVEGCSKLGMSGGWHQETSAIRYHCDFKKSKDQKTSQMHQDISGILTIEADMGFFPVW